MTIQEFYEAVGGDCKDVVAASKWMFWSLNFSTYFPRTAAWQRFLPPWARKAQ